MFNKNFILLWYRITYWVPAHNKINHIIFVQSPKQVSTYTVKWLKSTEFQYIKSCKFSILHTYIKCHFKVISLVLLCNISCSAGGSPPSLTQPDYLLTNSPTVDRHWLKMHALLSAPQCLFKFLAFFTGQKRNYRDWDYFSSLNSHKYR